MIIVVQGIGLLATALVAITYIENSRVVMLLLQFSSSILFTIHYFLLGAHTGALLSILVAIRCLAYFKWEKNKVFVVFFMITFSISGISTWQNVFSVLPTLGSVLFSLAFWFKNPRQIRLLSILPSCLWGAYGILTGSWGGIATEIICISSIIIGFFRYDFKK